MLLKKKIPLLFSIILLVFLLVLSFYSRNFNIKNVTKQTLATSDISVDNNSRSDEMRGVWITYMDLSMENEQDKSENAFRDKFENIAKNCVDFGFNTLIVQVRPFSDAIYESNYYPWSHIISGSQGENPKYDPLNIICEICDSYKLDIHAWINPYRVKSEKIPNELSESNPYIKDKTIGKVTQNGIYLDPSNSKARELIISGVIEIVENYDVDGIQFDDYFYPTTDTDFDNNEYETYTNSVGVENSMSLENWRKANVNMLICGVYQAIHKTRDNVVFGISPQGNIDNNESLYAEVKSWCICRGFVDYICPQIYFSLKNPSLTFENSLNSWYELDFSSEVKLYIGLAGYKAGTNEDKNTWLQDNNILAQEYKILQANKLVKGFMLYSYSSISDSEAEKEMNNLKNELN